VAGQPVIVVKLETNGEMYAAASRTLEAMGDLGRLEQVDEALVEAVRVLASTLDYDAGNASLWREFRGALADLRGLNVADADPELERLAAEMRAAVGDT
jgi:hypothetical protein